MARYYYGGTLTPEQTEALLKQFKTLTFGLPPSYFDDAARTHYTSHADPDGGAIRKRLFVCQGCGKTQAVWAHKLTCACGVTSQAEIME